MEVRLARWPLVRPSSDISSTGKKSDLGAKSPNNLRILNGTHDKG